jgi:RNA polymerase subunit RPABC4/transcription elongation factor Spt4
MRMPSYQIENDGQGPYARFSCEMCEREFPSTPISLPSAADRTSLTPRELAEAWQQVQVNFRECSACARVVCVSNFDFAAGKCEVCSGRRQKEAEKWMAALTGLASAFGLGIPAGARGEQACPQCGRLVTEGASFCPSCGARVPAGAPEALVCPQCRSASPLGTKFCPDCGGVLPVSGQEKTVTCPSCRAAMPEGTKFCQECGARMPVPQIAPSVCPQCGEPTKGAKFCGNCGARLS